MNGRMFAKVFAGLKLDGGKLFYNGVECQQLGNGSYRTVFAVPGTKLVAKVEHDDSDDQSMQEWEAYLALRKTEFRKHIVKMCKPRHMTDWYRDRTSNVSLHQRVQGQTVAEVRYTLRHRAKSAFALKDEISTKHMDKVQKLLNTNLKTQEESIQMGERVMVWHKDARRKAYDMGIEDGHDENFMVTRRGKKVTLKMVDIGRLSSQG